jgi:hypothetical protein
MPVYELTANPTFAKVQEAPKPVVRKVLKAPAPPRPMEDSEVEAVAGGGLMTASSTIEVTPLEVTAKKSIPQNENAVRTWVTDLTGRTFADAMPIIQFHRLSYRIQQIDGIMLPSPSKLHRQEVVLTINTPMNFAVSGITMSDKARDQAQAQNWFHQHYTSSVVLRAELNH